MTTMLFLAGWAIRSSIMILAGAILVSVLRVRDATLRWAVLTAMLCGSLLIPVMSTTLPSVNIGIPKAMERRAPMGATTVQPSVPVAKPFDWGQAVLAVYVLISAILFSRVCMGLGISLVLLRRSLTTNIPGIRESDRISAPRNGALPSRGMTKKSIAAMVAVGSPLAYVIAAAEPQNAKPGLAFDSVEIRAAAPNTMPQMRSRFGNGRYELHNATAVDLIRTAWGVEADGISGGPEWLDLNRYDVIAMAPATATPEMLKTMLQGMLHDRFHLSVHNGNKDNPAYAITAERKPQLKPSEGTEASGCKFQPVPTVPRGVPLPQMTLVCSNVTIPAFAKILSRAPEASGYVFDYPLLDRTGLAGARNFSLTWSPRRAYNWSPAPGEVVTLFDAFEKLGLKLALTKVATPVLVVEKATPPRVSDAPKPHMEFEVAVIRPEDPNGPATPCGGINIQPGGRVRINMTLRNLIWEAWGAPFDFSRFIGGPKGMDSPCWQILAKVSVEQNILGTANPGGWNGAIWNGVDVDTMRMSLRSFLVDRFKLAAHLEDHPIDGYALAAGPKLKKANPANRPSCKEGPGEDGKDPRLTNPLATRLITCRNMTLTQFAEQLNGFFPGSPPMTDATGISGRFDMTINFSPTGPVQAVPSEPGDVPEPTDAISLFDALKGQLGLKVRTRKVIAPVLIVDHVNATPTEN